jgi:hypothetical protein
MRLEVAAFRDPGEHPLPRSIAVPVPKSNHRPPTEYRFFARSDADVNALSRHRLPIHLLTAARVSDLGYPVVFPSQAVVAESFRPLLETTLQTIPFVSTEAARSPRVEDTIVALLRFDMLGARAIFDRNRERFDSTYLTRRILEENVERRAAFVRFSDVLPGIPPTSDSMNRDALDRKLAKHSASPRGR